MDAYNTDPRGLRKRRHGWQAVLQEYAVPIAGLSLFLCVCVMVALHGRAGYWQKQAAEHQGHHHRFKASHSSLQQALQMKERDLEDTHRHRQTTQERVDDLQHQLEAEMRQLAAVRTELHAAQAEGQEARHEMANAKHDLDTCLHRVRMHGDSSQALEKQVADLKQHVAAHEARELQLLTNKQELETAVERWKAQAEAKGVHLDNPAGMAGLMAHGLSNSGKVPMTNLPAPPVPSAPPVDGVQHAARMLGVQQSAAVPDAPVVVQHLDVVPKPVEEQQKQRPAVAAPDL